MIFVVGARGRLGAALLRAYPPGQARALAREVYETWWQPGARAAIRAQFAEAQPGSVVYVASGTLDPGASPGEHERVNELLPRHIIEAAAEAGLKVVTFGTVMETLLDRKNPYVASKARLGEYVARAPGDVLHVRIHTLYGGAAPAPFMFLGQMLAALRAQQPFRMTSGRQLREYHHVDDEAAAIARLVAQGVRGPVDVSHGQPVALVELARAVFAAAGRPDLLHAGALPEPAEENYDRRFVPTPQLAGHSFRPALAAVPQYLMPFARPQ